MPKWILVFVIAFVSAELAVRIAARVLLGLGNTVHVFGPLYITHTVHHPSTMAFGLSATTWLAISLLISISFALIFWQAARLLPAFPGKSLVVYGWGGAMLLTAIVTLNMAENAVVGGVTDYLALMDLRSKRGWVINLADVAIMGAGATVMVGYVGLIVGLVRYWVGTRQPV